MRRTLGPALLLLVATGCTEEPSPPPVGDLHQYAVGELHLARTNTEARQYSLDVNGDGTPDNQLGLVFSALEGQGYAIADTADEALVRGRAIMLAQLQTTSFERSEVAGVQTFLGASPVPAACTDPDDLATCGQHLQTRAHYDLLPDGASDLGAATFVEGRFEAAIGTLPVELSISNDGPIRVDLQRARIQLVDMTATGGTAVVTGGITLHDRDNVVIPAATGELQRIVATDCTPATTSCGCPTNSRGLQLLELFDLDDSCAIDVDEVRTSNLVQALLSPDLGTGRDQLLSFGFGVAFVPAEFIAP